MGDKAYLWELDSVRNSVEECRIAREVLFNTLLVEGKTVVMTFNQLADGKWILPFLKDEESYQYLLKLFQVEAIKLSHYERIQTVSHYVQNALEKALQKRNDFIFSGMDIKKEERYIVQEILETIRYSDPERLMEDMNCLQKWYDNIYDFMANSEQMKPIKQVKDPVSRWRKVLQGQKAEYVSFDIQVCRYYYLKGIMDTPEKFKACLKYEIDRLQIIYRYVKAILFISEKKTLDNKALKTSTSYATIMDFILSGEISKALKDLQSPWVKLFEDAVGEMRTIKDTYQWTSAKIRKEKSINNRSVWHNLINSKRKTDQEDLTALRDFEILLADVCYNFTLESSIDGIECLFDKKDDKNKVEFIEDLIKRVDERYNVLFLKNYKIGNAHNVDVNKEECLNWKQLVEIREDVYKLDSTKNHKPASWSGKVRKTQVSSSVKVFGISVLLFITVNFLGDICYNIIAAMCTDIMNYLKELLQTELKLLSNYPQDLETIWTMLWSLAVQSSLDLMNIDLINILVKSIDVQIVFAENTNVCWSVIKAVVKTAIKVIGAGLIISYIQRKKPLDILDIITEWRNKLSNWKMFKRKVSETEKLEENLEQKQTNSST